MLAFRKLARSKKVGVVLVHNTGKSFNNPKTGQEQSAVERAGRKFLGRGAAARQDKADVGINYVKVDDTTRMMQVVKSRTSNLGTQWTLAFNGNHGFNIKSVSHLTGFLKPYPLEKDEKLRNLLSTYPDLSLRALYEEHVKPTLHISQATFLPACTGGAYARSSTRRISNASRITAQARFLFSRPFFHTPASTSRPHLMCTLPRSVGTVLAALLGRDAPRLLHVKAEGVFLLIDVYTDGLFGVILWKGARRQKPLHKGTPLHGLPGWLPMTHRFQITLISCTNKPAISVNIRSCLLLSTLTTLALIKSSGSQWLPAARVNFAAYGRNA